jgi:chromosomal replication initiator protein
MEEVFMIGAWQNTLDELKKTIPASQFSTFFVKLTFSMDGKTVLIGVPNVFFIKQFKTKYDAAMAKALKNNGVEFKEIQYVVNSEEKKKGNSREIRVGDAEKIAKKGAAREGKTEENGLNPKFRFDNFVVGSNNDLAVSAARAVVESPGTKYNPYFLYGGPGLGKTHLIQAIGNELRAKDPNLKILYITTEQFYHAFVEAMRKHIDGFEKKYRSVDVLIFDDIHMIAGKDKSQDAFFNTFNELHLKNKQIIVSSDRLPSQIATMDARLASRLTAGIPIDIQMPDFETRCAILKTKAEFLGVEIEDSAVEYLADNIKTNIRELEGKLNQLLALSDLRDITPSEVISEGYLESIQTTKFKAITPKQIVDNTAKFFGLSVKDICSESRARDIALPRQVAMYLLAEEIGLSTPKIAEELGRKDHTTAMHSIKKIRNEMRLNFTLREQVTMIRDKLYV